MLKILNGTKAPVPQRVGGNGTSLWDPQNGESKGEERSELVYGITNVPRTKADAKRLLELNRKHWWIENRLPYRRDVTLGEDASQVRSVGAPEVLAALNGGLLALLDFQGVKNVAKHMRHLCAQPREALQLLLGKLSRHYG